MAKREIRNIAGGSRQSHGFNVIPTGNGNFPQGSTKIFVLRRGANRRNRKGRHFEIK